MVTCPACGHQVPDGNHCIRCGTPVVGERRGGAGREVFSASPDEGRSSPRLVSTFFPQLPRADMKTFRVALVGGLAGVLVLGLAGMFPLAIAGSAVLVPLLMVLYFFDVDLYEDEPLLVVALTMLWGVAVGVGVGLISRAVSWSGAGLLGDEPGSEVLVRGVAIPLLGFVLVLVGPLILLPYRKFNDVLDGATFGAAAAVSYAGALLLTHSSALFAGGLRPVGSVGPWVARLLELSVALPILYAGAAGSATGAFWLRYRAPVHDRDALGPLGRPVLASAVAAAMWVAGGVGQVLLPRYVSLALLAILALAALLWLRRVIHVGLTQEASEIELGPDITCPNCGATTPHHSFCANCGVSLLALPKARRRTPAPNESAVEGGG
jgi:hypothetical protein